MAMEYGVGFGSKLDGFMTMNMIDWILMLEMR